MRLVRGTVKVGLPIGAGSSRRCFNFDPGWSCHSKALGNGYAISACVGREEYRRAAREVFLTGSCWNDAVAMAAALKCLQLAKEKNLVENLDGLGRRLADGLLSHAKKQGHSFVLTGPPVMPFPWFEEDDNLYLLQRFCGLCAEEGVFFHPHHNWFLCGAHAEADIDEALAVAGRAFARMAEEKG